MAWVRARESAIATVALLAIATGLVGCSDESTPEGSGGTSGAILDRDYHAPRAVQELKAAGLIRERGWHDGPGAIFVPTAEGEALYARLADSQPRTPPAPRWVKR